MSSPDTPARPARRRWYIAAGAVALVLATVAATALVTSGGPDSQPTAHEEASASASAAAASGSAASTAPTAKLYKFGEKATDPRFGATVYGYKQPSGKDATPPDQAGFEWASADVEVCVTFDTSVTRERWHLVYADHTVIDPSGTGYRQFQKPEYPWDERPVQAGRCLRGWITYGVPASTRPVMVEYTPSGGAIDWAVS